MVVVYHGGQCEVREPEIRAGKYAKDFGKGFYCTELRAQAERWAKRYETPVVSVFAWAPGAGLDMLSFAGMTEAWLDFVVACRGGASHPHDAVTGAMADDQVWNYIADFMAGILTRDQFWALARFKHPTHQLAVCTEAALGCLSFRESYGVAK